LGGGKPTTLKSMSGSSARGPIRDLRKAVPTEVGDREELYTVSPVFSESELAALSATRGAEKTRNPKGW